VKEEEKEEGKGDQRGKRGLIICIRVI